MCKCKDCEAAIRINELFHEEKAAKFTGKEFPPWKYSEMHFLAYLITGAHA